MARLVEAAYAAVTAGGTQSESWVLDQLKSGNQNQRLFCVMVLPQVTDGPQAAVPRLLKATNDAEPRVRMLARYLAARLDHDSPEVLAALQSALVSPNQDEVIAGAYLVYGVDTFGKRVPSWGLPAARPIWKAHPDLILAVHDRGSEPSFVNAMDAMSEQLDHDSDRSGKVVEREERLQFDAWVEAATTASGERLRKFLAITEDMASGAVPRGPSPSTTCSSGCANE